VDEALGLMAALKSRSSILAKEAGRLEAILVKKEEASQ
jgi:biotin carboxyl carrier protein